jgi:ankyrin repeat protein/spore coat protein CotH
MSAASPDERPPGVNSPRNLATNLIYYLLPLAAVCGLCLAGVIAVTSYFDTQQVEPTAPEVVARPEPVEPVTPQVELFPTDRVMDVQISVEDKDWNKIRFQTRNLFEVLQTKRKTEVIPSPYVYVPATVTIDGVEYSEVGIRKKGFIGSQNASRPSLKVKLNFVNKSARVDGLKNLTFNNNNQDITLMSQFMGYALFNAAGSPAPRCSYARISVNGKPIGVYTHVETVRESLLKREFGNSDGTLYEGSVVDFFDGWEGSFELKVGTPEQDLASRKKIIRLIEVLKRPGPVAGADEKTRTRQGQDLQQAIGELVDLDSFYTYWAVESLLGFWDGYTANTNNYFVYDNPATGKFHFMPWGADCMFEKHSKLRVDPAAPLTVKTKGLVAHKLYQIPAARERFARTMQGLLETHWKEDALLAETQRIEALCSPLIPASQAATVRFENIRDFIGARRGDIEKETANGMPLWAAKPSPPPLLGVPPGGGKQDTDTIFFAARTGDVDAIKTYLDKKVDVNGRDTSGTTAISHAVLSGKLKTVRFLISRGADVTKPNRDRNTVLHGAAFLGYAEIAQLLIKNGAVLNARNDKGETPLDSSAAPWSAEIQGIVQFIAGLLQIDVEMDRVRIGRPQVVAMLREAGALLGAQVAAAASMDIWQAAKNGNLEALKLRLADAPDLNALDNTGISPLAWAVMAGKPLAARMLIDQGADVNHKNTDGTTPLHGAALLGQFDLVELLLENKADINSRNGQDQTPLGTVAPKWNSGIRQITQFYARVLKLEIDVEAIKIARPRITTLLRLNGAKL